MLTINPSSGVKQISALSKSVGAKEENRPATHEGKRGEEAAALTAVAQGARSRLPGTHRRQTGAFRESSRGFARHCSVPGH